MQKLSAVIITLNEERNIERCIKSLLGIADEIVVLDSFSNDNTEKICQQYQVKFFQQTWKGYSEQKNYANSLAINDLILSIDADEALSDELRQSIQKILSTELGNKVFSISRLTNYCGSWIKHCGWYPDTKIRIFDRRFTSWKNMKVHEELDLRKDTEIVHLHGNLLHYSYYTLHDHLQQINKFTDLTAHVAFQKEKKSPNIILIILHSRWKFFRDYIFKLGFLDGYAGFLVCKYSAMATFTKYAKLKQLHTKQKKQ